MSWSDLVSSQNTNQHIADVFTNSNVLTLENPSAIPENQGGNLSEYQVFPNPVGDHFYIYMRKMVSTTANINLYNAAGQLVYTKNINLINGSEYIEVPSQYLSSGAYFLRINAGEFKFVKKLIR